MWEMSESKGRIGWLGAGRMGVPMVERLLAAHYPILIWNRTASRLADLVTQGAHMAKSCAEVASAEVVFSMVADDAALDALHDPETGFLRAERAPRIWVDCSTVSTAASESAARAAKVTGTRFLCAPVSGNPSVVRAGNLIFAVSGDESAYRELKPIFDVIGRGSHYVGADHQARTIKLCTNLLLGITAQALAEIIVLAERSGVTRTALLGFINDSAIGSPFTKYKSAAFINLDFTPTFTPEGQRKDIRLAISQGAELEVPMPLASATEVEFSRLIASGLGANKDFGALLLQVARDAGLELARED